MNLAHQAIREAVGYQESFQAIAQGMQDQRMVDAEFKKMVAGLWPVAADDEGRKATQRRPEAEVTVRDGLLIGLAQCVALIPGVSRSGATIVGALALGADKRTAAEFSFYLAMPTMAGAFAYDLMKNRDILDGAALLNVAVGFVFAFLAAVVVVRWLLGYVSRHGYAVFAWWRIVVGLLVFALLFVEGSVL